MGKGAACEDCVTISKVDVLLNDGREALVKKEVNLDSGVPRDQSNHC